MATKKTTKSEYVIEVIPATAEARAKIEGVKDWGR